eukprot:CAMPEP_0177589086 /NCGR_PEP_ID=MMETSP0419_2-20121207/6595_1 /TAXON_ID=582737 /ORGANISM="Tetraselmis sp., Strain GSL018" /LENGTH=151 /DNA_ID=CAMNT_0019079375 /DNA_START=120 /DNA_END=575 /DNA_ORIENTATION=-
MPWTLQIHSQAFRSPDPACRPSLSFRFFGGRGEKSGRKGCGHGFRRRGSCGRGSGHRALVRIPPADEHNGCLVVDVRSDDNAEVEQVVAVKGEVEGARLPPLGNASGIDSSADEVCGAHQEVVDQSFLEERYMVVNRPLVHYRHYTKKPQA